MACNDPNIRKIFEITLLDRIFEIYPTPEEAIRHLSGETAAPAATINDRGIGHSHRGNG